MKNAASPKEVERAGLRERYDVRQLNTDFAGILETVGGRRFVWWLLDKCGVFRSSFTGNSSTFYNEGMRQVGLDIIAKIAEVNPNALVLMMTESKKREESHEST